jgi:predicted hydrocarbon binding protein
MDTELDKLTDEVWQSSLARIAKKELPVVRPFLGDDIDLYVPQTRTLLMVEDNPAIASSIYNPARVSASRNVFIIMKKLGMPADYFWKFEYWVRDRAYDTLRKVINKVFSSMMNMNKEGILDLQDVDIDRMRLTVIFKDCVECAGVVAEKGICYYHAGTFAGIMSALLNKDLDAFETTCHAKGDGACTFIIGKKDDPEISSIMSNYLLITKIETQIPERVNTCLQGDAARGMGNLVNVGYYYSILANSLIANPAEVSSSGFDTGVDFGTRLAPIITAFYKDNQIDVIKKYYAQLHHIDIKMIEVGENVEITMAECAEAATMLKSKELLTFLFGELQGLVSQFLNRKMVYQESAFENGNVRIRLSPQA